MAQGDPGVPFRAGLYRHVRRPDDPRDVFMRHGKLHSYFIYLYGLLVSATRTNYTHTVQRDTSLLYKSGEA